MFRALTGWMTPRGIALAGLLAVATLAMLAAGASGTRAAVSVETIDLTGTVRDFNDAHPDFESVTGVDPGIVQTALGTDKKPVYTGQAGNPTTHGQEAFDQWYRDVPSVNMTGSQ